MATMATKSENFPYIIQILYRLNAENVVKRTSCKHVRVSHQSSVQIFLDDFPSSIPQAERNTPPKTNMTI